MQYNFDEIVDRKNTNCVKYDMTQEIFGTSDLIPAWVADMDFKTPDFITKAIKKRAEHEIYGYTFQNKEFIESFINWIKHKHNWHIKHEWISFSPGVVPALAISVLAYTKPSENILLHSPVYHPFFSSITKNDRNILNSPLILRNSNYTFNFDEIEEKYRQNCKLHMFCNPHNPVGRVWTQKELEKIADLSLKFKVPIVSDEIHSDLILSKYQHIPLASLSEEIAQNTITTFAPSKTFNIAGLSASVVVIPNKNLKQQYDKISHGLHLHIGNLFGITAFTQAYTHGHEWLAQLIKYLENNIDFTEFFFRKHLPKIKVIKPQGTYLVWLDFREFGLEQKKLNEILIKEAKVGLNDGTMFGQGGKGFQRLNVGCTKKTLEEILERIVKTFLKI